MSLYLGLPVSILLAILQSAVTSRLQIFGVSPNLALLFTVGWVLFCGVRQGIAVALVGGLVLDALSGAPFGFSTLSLLLASLVAGLGESNVFRTAWFLPYLVIALATLAYEGTLMFLLRMAGRPMVWAPALGRIVFPEALLNLLFMPLVYMLLGRLRVIWGPESAEWQ
ncbi:MAG: rod shape-determining protein MreD [Anaerolineae bacterium]|nr:rod shape-determining protein MreD [Anaerolineae bacterium]